MTNGEKIKEVFPSIELYEKSHDAIQINFDSVWWNTEYKDPTTKNDLGVDCISRAEAIKCLECDFDITGKENMKTVVNYINSAHDKIVNLPRVKQEPKTGHWIYVGEENEEETKAGNFRYVCSECGFTDVHGKSTYVPYCWQCGAKMAETEADNGKID